MGNRAVIIPKASLENAIGPVAGIVAVDGMGLYHVVPVGDGFDLEPLVDE